MFHLTKSLTDSVHKVLCSAVLYYPSFQITDSDLNITVNECELIETYKALHPITAKYSFFFSSACGTFTKMDYILGQRSLTLFYRETTNKYFRLCEPHNLSQHRTTVMKGPLNNT